MIDRKGRVELALFAKAPVPGKVKTRLTTVFSAEQACAIHCQLIELMCDNLAQCVDLDWRLWVSEHHTYFNDLAALHSVSIEQQRGGGLGERLQDAANRSLSRADQCILIGSDCPDLTAAYVHEAMNILAQPDCDIVIGPATDGGYVLLGLKQRRAELFTDIDWGSNQVFAQTQKKIRESGLGLRLLPKLSDIDHPDDVRQCVALHSSLPHF